MTFLKKLFRRAFRRGTTIEEIVSPIRLIAANLAEYEAEKAKSAEKAEVEAAKLAKQITDDLAEARRAKTLSNHYRLLVDGPDAVEPTAVAAE